MLHNISWETFEALLRETGEDRGSRFAYECGTLEIMSPLFEHENPKSNLGNFTVALAEELDIEIRSAGSTTLKRRLAKRLHKNRWDSRILELKSHFFNSALPDAAS